MHPRESVGRGGQGVRKGHQPGGRGFGAVRPQEQMCEHWKWKGSACSDPLHSVSWGRLEGQVSPVTNKHMAMGTWEEQV